MYWKRNKQGSSESLLRDSDSSEKSDSKEPCLLSFQYIFFLLRLLLFDLMYLMSSDESDLIDDDSDFDGSDSGSSGRYYFCTFSFCFEDSVGSVGSLGSGVFCTNRIQS